MEDVQHQKGTQPYSSSKYASDLLSLALNTHYNKQVGCHTPHMFMHVFFLKLLMMSITVILLLLCFLGFVLVCHLSWFCDDQSDLRYPAILPRFPLDAAYASLLACEY